MENLSNLMQTKLWLVLFINHTAMLILSMIIMLVVSKGKLSRYGFKLTRNIRLGQIVLWGLGIGIISTLIEGSLPGEGSDMVGELSFLQQIIFIWIYASIAEEVLTRGLIQSSLASWGKYGFSPPKGIGFRINLPVLVSALFFGLMHAMQSAMGAGGYTVIVTVLSAFILGLVAGYHREKTQSLAPAIIVHLFANVGGSLAGFLMGLLR